jgi:hypothetical protein
VEETRLLLDEGFVESAGALGDFDIGDLDLLERKQDTLIILPHKS